MHGLGLVHSQLWLRRQWGLFKDDAAPWMPADGVSRGIFPLDNQKSYEIIIFGALIEYLATYNDMPASILLCHTMFSLRWTIILKLFSAPDLFSPIL